MIRFLLTCLSLFSFAALPALAETPNRTTMGFETFVEASGCVLVDKGGYSNLAASDGGNCPASVVQAFVGNAHRIDAGADGILGTADDKSVSDN
ncbi:MAG: hypothetical protein V4720_06355 [Pseudomonadota bacterium]